MVSLCYREIEGERYKLTRVARCDLVCDGWLLQIHIDGLLVSRGNVAGSICGRFKRLNYFVFL
jgi:hypothetical protein